MNVQEHYGETGLVRRWICDEEGRLMVEWLAFKNPETNEVMNIPSTLTAIDLTTLDDDTRQYIEILLDAV